MDTDSLLLSARDIAESVDIIRVLFGRFSDKFGTIAINNDVCQMIDNVLKDKFGAKVSVWSEKVYRFRDTDMVMSENRNAVPVYHTTMTKYTSFNSKMCVTVQSVDKLDKNKFPVLDKYHDVKSHQVTQYKIKDVTVFIHKTDDEQSSVELSYKLPAVKKGVSVAHAVLRCLS